MILKVLKIIKIIIRNILKVTEFKKLKISLHINFEKN